jgi:hypothetical protein
MQFRDLDEKKLTKTVFVRKNGVLKALTVPTTTFSYPKNQTPIFPITKDRDNESK